MSPVICNMGYSGCSNFNDICQFGCICTAVNTQPLPDTPPIHSDPAGEVKLTKSAENYFKSIHGLLYAARANVVSREFDLILDKVYEELKNCRL